MRSRSLASATAHRWPIALMSFLIGLLLAFCAWSVEWALTARRQLTYDFPGKVSSFTLSLSGPASVEIDKRRGLEELERYLGAHRLAVAIASNGDGRPMISVLDPDGRVAWFPRTPSSGSPLDDHSLFLFSGSYAHASWSRDGSVPFAPPGARVGGIIRAPGGAEGLQFAGSLSEESFEPGTLVVNTVDPGQVVELARLVSSLGLELSDQRALPLGDYLRNNPMLRLTTAFLAMGLAASTAYLVLFFRSRDREWCIRSRYGATLRQLARGQLALTLPPAIAFGASGSASSALFVHVVTQADIRPPELEALAVAAAMAGVLTASTWAIVFLFTLRTRVGEYVA